MEDLCGHNSWRIFRIMAEFVEGYQLLKQSSDPHVVIFGSARSQPEDKVYKAAEQTGNLLAQAGYGVITGGGPGVMEAANKGAKKAGGRSVGFNITLPFEQEINKHLTDSFTFDYFFIRKAMFVYYSKAFIVFAGGLGTMDELFDVITLIQTEKIPKRPIIIYDSKFYKTLINLLQHFADQGTISLEDLDLITYVDSPEEVVKIIEE